MNHQQWNEKYKVGLAVSVKRAGGQQFKTTTRSQAWSSGGMNLIKVNGIAGAISLESITVLAPGQRIAVAIESVRRSYPRGKNENQSKT